MSSYLFTQNSGSFTSITGTTLGTATANTGAASLYNVSFPVTLPFSFNFNNQNYTDITASSNGYITFGTGTATGSVPISTATAYDGAISAWGRSINSINNLGGKSGSMSWTVEGTAPNRVAVFQWENFRPSYSTSTASVFVFSFQIRLAETTNEISTVYSAGSLLVGTGAFSSTNAQIGLRGATNADFNNRTNPITISFANSNSGIANNNGQSFNTLVDPPGMPADGLTYNWTPSTCIQPSAVTIDNVTTSSATVSWTAPANAPANGYDVYHSTSNTSPNTTTTPTFAGVMGLSQNLTGLTSSSEYFVWVRSVCNATESSSWLAVPAFNTLCPAVTTMFEDFDSYTTGSIVPACWDRIIIGSGTQTISSSGPNSGTRNLYQYSSSALNQSIVVLPPFSNVNAGTHRLRFKARMTAAPRDIEFGYVTNATDANSFVLLETRSITNTVYTAADSEYKFNVPTSVPANARLAIKNPGGTSTVTFYYDDVYWELAPTCIAPTSVSASNITTTTAAISWDASISTPPNGYDVYYSTTNTAPIATTAPNHTNIAALTQNLSGLVAATTYYVWVRAVCSSTDQSSWTALPSFTTLCDPVATMFEDFDSYATGSIVPVCWDRIIIGSGTQTISSSSPNSGTRNLYQYSSSAVNQSIVILPPFSNVNAGTHWLRLKARMTAAPRTIEFGYVTDPTDANTFVMIEAKSITNTTYTDPASEYTFSLPTTVPANARVAIKNPGGSATVTFYYDDVYWELAPTCLPPTDIVEDSVTPTTATASWTASITPPANGYEVYYSTSNTPPTSSTVPNATGITGLSTTLSGLNPLTGYFVWVRSACSGSDISTWSDFGKVNTACQPPAIIATTVSPTPVCVGGTATFTATSDAGATIQWYDAATAGNNVATGPTFTTPILTATTNYWVSAGTGSSGTVGPVSPSSLGTISASSYAVGTYHQIFDVISATTLVSIDVFPVSSVTIGTASAIEIRDNAGTTVISVPYTVSVNDGVTPQTVTLNAALPVGTGYRIGQGIAINLNRNTSGAIYPYTSSNINITGNNFSSGPDYWYYIYNWNFSTTCESARTMVTATYDSSCNLGTTEIRNGRKISVYPNPFTDVLNISDVKDVVSVSITDLSGRVVKTIAKPSAQIHLGELQSGMYLVTLKYKDGSVKTVKAIKK